MENKTNEVLNYETPLEALAQEITDNHVFYKRNHFPSPEISSADWNLKIELGSVKASFSLDELRSFQQRSVSAVLECAGNMRTNFGFKVEGEFEWGNGAVASAIWTGVPLNFLITKSGFNWSELSEITEVIFVGSDGATQIEVPIESRKKYARSLPHEKALDQDTIVALGMNGQALPKDHGFPARLIVPGWYAMASVKWLDRIILSKSAEEFQGYFNKTKYVYVTEESSEPKITP